jgi:hypothetical protein
MNIKLSPELRAALGNPTNSAEALVNIAAVTAATTDFGAQLDAAIAASNTQLADLVAKADASNAKAEEIATAITASEAQIAALVGDSDKIKSIAEAAASTVAGQALTATGNTPAAAIDAAASDATDGASAASELDTALEAKEWDKVFDLSSNAKREFDSSRAFGAYMAAADAGRVAQFDASK